MLMSICTLREKPLYIDHHIEMIVMRLKLYKDGIIKMVEI